MRILREDYKTERKYVITIEDNSRDGSEFDLVCYKNGRLFKRLREVAVDDSFINLYKFYDEICDEENIDYMHDEVRVKIDINCRV